MSDLVRTITHWTGGGGRANALDKKHYNFITEWDGTVVEGNETPEDNIVTSDGDYAAHTRNLNTGSIGCAMAGMKDAKEYPLDFGPSPINREQFEAHCKLLAEVHRAYGIPVTNRTCITHAEVEPTLGVKQNGKWDITVLEFEPGIRGAIPVGNYMRKRVRAYMGEDAFEGSITLYPTLTVGHRGAMVQNAQFILAETRHFPGKVDGIFGPRTRDAVMSFQADNGLIVDGVVGQNTWRALMLADPRPERDVSAKDLREEGSVTIKEADKTEVIAGIGGAAATVTAVSDTVSGATGALGEAESALQMLQHLLLTYWPSLALLAGCAAVYVYARRIKRARVKDARIGANMGR